MGGGRCRRTRLVGPSSSSSSLLDKEDKVSFLVSVAFGYANLAWRSTNKGVGIVDDDGASDDDDDDDDSSARAAAEDDGRFQVPL